MLVCTYSYDLEESHYLARTLAAIAALQPEVTITTATDLRDARGEWLLMGALHLAPLQTIEHLLAQIPWLPFAPARVLFVGPHSYQDEPEATAIRRLVRNAIRDERLAGQVLFGCGGVALEVCRSLDDRLGHEPRMMGNRIVLRDEKHATEVARSLLFPS